MMLHKIATIAAIIILVGGGYFGYNKLAGNATNEIRYVLAQVEKGTIILSVTGSGQVSSSNQIDIKPKASGEVIKVNVTNGQEVKAGDLLVQLDAQDAFKTVRDAEANLKSAQLSLEKLKQPTSAYSIMQAENALESAKTSLEKLKLSQETNYLDAQDAIQQAEDNLTKDYDDSYNAVADAFLDLPSIITNLYNTLYSNGLSANTSIVGNNIYILENSVYFFNNKAGYDQLQNLINLAENKYDIARQKYDANFTTYQNASRTDSHDEIKSLLDQTLDTTTAIAEAAQSEANLLDYWVDYRAQFGYGTYAQVTTYQSNLATYISQTNGHLSSLSTNQSAIENDQNSLDSAQRDLTTMEQNNPLDLAAAEATVSEKQASLDNLKAGTDPLDIRAQELTIQQRQNALADAYNMLADYSIKAPIDGVIADVTVKKGDTASAGTAAITLITKQSIAEISLNEVDVAKVKVGQKANLTFDAVNDLNITGEVIQIDTIGTVSQGVVTYNVKIVFDTQDERIKPGMSVSTAIITDSKQDVLLVPNSAIKTVGSASYVEMPDEEISSTANAANNNGVILKKSPRQQLVQIGLVNDSMTEIINGLKENEQVVTQTITGNTTQTQSQNSRSFGIPGFGVSGPR